jgi:hypothetical protein
LKLLEACLCDARLLEIIQILSTLLRGPVISCARFAEGMSLRQLASSRKWSALCSAAIHRSADLRRRNSHVPATRMDVDCLTVSITTIRVV